MVILYWPVSTLLKPELLNISLPEIGSIVKKLIFQSVYSIKFELFTFDNDKYHFSKIYF